MTGGIELFDPTFDALERAMRIESMRQAVTSQNIANAKTPGYRALTFDEKLLQAVERLDKKEVVLEEELANLSKNRYSDYVRILTSKLNALKTVAAQGRR